VGSGFALTGHDVGAQSIMTRVTITDNLVTGIDVAPFTGDGRGFLINNDPIDLVIAHNTVLDADEHARSPSAVRTRCRRRASPFRDNILDGGQRRGHGRGGRAPRVHGVSTAGTAIWYRSADARGNRLRRGPAPQRVLTLPREGHHKP
jgi:hypothetical protein